MALKKVMKFTAVGIKAVRVCQQNTGLTYKVVVRYTILHILKTVFMSLETVTMVPWKNLFSNLELVVIALEQ